MTKTVAVPVELLEELIEQHITAKGFTNETARRAQAILSAPVVDEQHPLIKCLNENGERIAANATIAQQAEYIRLLERDAGRYRVLRSTPTFALTLGKSSTPEQIDALCDLALHP